MAAAVADSFGSHPAAGGRCLLLFTTSLADDTRISPRTGHPGPPFTFLRQRRPVAHARAHVSYSTRYCAYSIYFSLSRSLSLPLVSTFTLYIYTHIHIYTRARAFRRRLRRPNSNPVVIRVSRSVRGVCRRALRVRRGKTKRTRKGEEKRKSGKKKNRFSVRRRHTAVGGRPLTKNKSVKGKQNSFDSQVSTPTHTTPRRARTLPPLHRYHRRRRHQHRHYYRNHRSRRHGHGPSSRT